MSGWPVPPLVWATHLRLNTRRLMLKYSVRHQTGQAWGPARRRNLRLTQTLRKY